MRNPLVIILVLVGVCLVGLPPVLGSFMESRLVERIAEIDAAENNIRLSITDYDKGWFRSRAQIEFRIGNVALDQIRAANPDVAEGFGVEPISVDLQVAHGPVAVLEGVHLGTARVIARADGSAPANAELATLLGVPHLIELRGNASFLGRFDFRAGIPAIQMRNAPTSITTAPLEFVGRLNGRQLEHQGSLPLLQFGIDGEPVVTTISALRFYGDISWELANAPTGTVNASIDDITVLDSSAPASPLFAMRELGLQQTAQLDAATGLMRSVMNISVASVIAPVDHW